MLNLDIFSAKETIFLSSTRMVGRAPTEVGKKVQFQSSTWVVETNALAYSGVQ